MTMSRKMAILARDLAKAWFGHAGAIEDRGILIPIGSPMKKIHYHYPCKSDPNKREELGIRIRVFRHLDDKENSNQNMKIAEILLGKTADGNLPEAKQQTKRKLH